MKTQRRYRHAMRLGVVVVAMFGFGYALVPLYNALCDALGINGRMPLVAAETLDAVEPDLSRTVKVCLLYTSPSPRDRTRSRMPSSA